MRARMLRANVLCVICSKAGIVRAATELDHIVPLHQGGTHDAANLQALCHECHRIKSARERQHQPRTAFDAQGLPITDGHHWI